MYIGAVAAKQRFEAHLAGRPYDTPVLAMYLDAEGRVVEDHYRYHIPFDFADNIALSLNLTDGFLDSPHYDGLVVYHRGKVVDWAEIHRRMPPANGASERGGLLWLEWLRGTPRDRGRRAWRNLWYPPGEEPDDRNLWQKLWMCRRERN
jgi:hypothetical protein